MEEERIVNFDELGEEEGVYITIPGNIVRSDATITCKFISSFVFSFSGAGKGNNDGKKSDGCRRTYKKLREELGFSYSTISAGLKGNFIKRDGRAYLSVDADAKRYYRVELFFFTDKFKIKHEGVRKLTPAEILIYAYFYTYCRNDKKQNKTKSASIPQIAWELNISKRTTWNAIRTLLRAGLIFRAEEEKGVNGYKYSTYHLNWKLLNRRKRRAKKAEDKPQPENTPEAASDQRADRERWYAERHAKVIAAVEKNVLRAEKCEAYMRANTALNTTEREIARAEVYNLPGLQELKNKRKGLRMQRIKALLSVGLTESDLSPQWQCAQCSDTGWRADGRACDCYFKR